MNPDLVVRTRLLSAFIFNISHRDIFEHFTQRQHRPPLRAILAKPATSLSPPVRRPLLRSERSSLSPPPRWARRFAALAVAVAVRSSSAHWQCQQPARCWALRSSDCKSIGRFPIENHHSSGVILHYLYIFNRKFQKQLAFSCNSRASTASVGASTWW